jgi:hypothetical protein
MDANGLGIGLLDYMIKKQVDPVSGATIPDFGVYNDEDGYYKKYRTPETEIDAIYAEGQGRLSRKAELLLKDGE